MAKPRAVVFTSNNARVVKGGELPRGENVLLNPDMSRVAGVAPHHWKRVGDEIHAMSAAEREARDRDIEARGADNAVSSGIAKPLPAPSAGQGFLSHFSLLLSGALLGFALAKIVLAWMGG